MTFTVAIVGRPNVGKSTLFNRLAGKRLALVDDTPGVTRDRREGVGSIADLSFKIIDTAGLEDAADDSLEARMRAQTEQALDGADVIMFVIDARSGLMPIDKHFADRLRRRGAPVILVANKCEGRGGRAGLGEAYALGLGDPLAVSAEHGEGMGDLYDALSPFAEAAKVQGEGEDDEVDGGDADDDDDERPLQLAIVGRPNVGKSTLVNYLLGEDRMLTGPEAGITRDSISIPSSFEGRSIQLVDTAGLRRKARITEKLEEMSVGASLHAVRFAQVVALTIDAVEGLEKQDLTIADMVVEEGRALIIVLNKWDLVKDRKKALGLLADRLETSLPQVRGVPVVTCSALTGKGVDDLLPAAVAVFKLWNKRISTGRLNRWLEVVTERHPPPLVHGRRLRIRYITQIKTRPPTFVIFAGSLKGMPESYARYLINSLRDDFDLPGVPLRLHVRKGKNPYVDE
ncbi:MAG: ribosome biogenesis GTPase Der [Rhodospirillales bacterium RIFCSPLOWO2_12_FULL_58_28]|nr:MAG: ribosome biogenesis GTPase Der [Rhodospirillales bacterium RIFCSPLOWO2_02_FULL_58_16]OHC78900.1 MAG: ribosome biogenesis GTPase Der [Rhodospirillales bacterium RIFCSPLOWO2_12_FULL_58_28]